MTAKSRRKQKPQQQSEQRAVPGVGGIEQLVLSRISSGDVDLASLVDEITREGGYDRDRVIRKLMELDEGKKIYLEEKSPYRSMFDYARSPLSLWFWGALLATLLSLALTTVSSGVIIYLRYVFGGLLILYLPGFSLIEFLYPKKKDLDDLVRLALSIGLSLAIVPLVGLALNYTPFGIRLAPTAISLSGITVILLILGLRRKHEYYKLARDVI
jgi:hypothetical protein